MHRLVVIRHGQSTWNQDNRFTGWTDVDLSQQGVAEARAGGKLLSEEGFGFDLCYTSVLKRAIRTLWLVLDELDMMWLPVERHWRLNERHYGGLTGLDKVATAEKYGKEQVFIWRRSYDIPPPPVDPASEFNSGRDPRYGMLAPDVIPASECLADVVDRMLPYWFDAIVPDLAAGHSVLIAAHGNSLRALVKYLDGVSDEDIVRLNIPTGVPLVYELDNFLNPVRSRYLGDADEVQMAMQSVANQGKSA